MNTAQRRTEILKLLQQEEKPVAARAMASQFGVSRQVIVQDMAVIRASTPGILSTTRGFFAQDICQKMFVLISINPINLVITAHDCFCVSFFNSYLKTGQIDFS